MEINSDMIFALYGEVSVQKRILEEQNKRLLAKVEELEKQLNYSAEQANIEVVPERE